MTMAKPEKKKPGAKRKQSSTKTVKARVAVVRQPAPVIDATRGAVLDRLWQVVLSRRDADPAVSHSARLLARGPAKVAQKFGEEAVECLIEAVSGNHEALVVDAPVVLLVRRWGAAR